MSNTPPAAKPEFSMTRDEYRTWAEQQPQPDVILHCGPNPPDDAIAMDEIYSE